MNSVVAFPCPTPTLRLLAEGLVSCEGPGGFKADLERSDGRWVWNSSSGSGSAPSLAKALQRLDVGLRGARSFLPLGRDGSALMACDAHHAAATLIGEEHEIPGCFQRRVWISVDVGAGDDEGAVRRTVERLFPNGFSATIGDMRVGTSSGNGFQEWLCRLDLDVDAARARPLPRALESLVIMSEGSEA